MSPAAATATAMTRDQNGYVRRETLVAVAINAALSAIFCFIVFGGSAAIAIADLVADAVPQSFMIALMTTIVPTLITRRRLRAGTIAPLALAGSRLPSNLALRALLVAMLAAAAGLASHWLLAPRWRRSARPCCCAGPWRIEAVRRPARAILFETQRVASGHRAD